MSVSHYLLLKLVLLSHFWQSHQAKVNCPNQHTHTHTHADDVALNLFQRWTARATSTVMKIEKSSAAVCSYGWVDWTLLCCQWCHCHYFWHKIQRQHSTRLLPVGVQVLKAFESRHLQGLNSQRGVHHSTGNCRIWGSVINLSSMACCRAPGNSLENLHH